MKLYTEEQVKGILIRHLNYSTLISLDEKDLEGAMENSVIEILNEMTPIELPSEQDIEKESMKFYDNDGADYYFEEGAKWVIEQIKQQDGK